MRKILLALVGVMLLLFGTVTPAVAHGHHSHPATTFRAHIHGKVSFKPAPAGSKCTEPPFVTVSRGAGNATLMGHVTMRERHCSGNDITGVIRLTGKHGSVSTRFAASCTPVPPFPPVVTCKGVYKLVGGTGRFAEAHGRGHMTAKVFPPQNVPNPITETWPGRWLLRGWIRY